MASSAVVFNGRNEEEKDVTCTGALLSKDSSSAAEEEEEECLPHNGSKVQTIPFFDLPREIRDIIYDYYWRSNPGLRAVSTPYHRLLLQLRYEGQYTMLIGEHGYTNPKDIAETFPTWLRASKEVLNEALEQFARKAAWFWGDEYLMQRPDDWSSGIFDTSKIRNMTIYIGHFGSVETPMKRQDGKCPIQYLRSFARAMAAHQSNGGGIQRLRISGHSSLMPYEGDFKRSIKTAHRILDIFSAVDITTLELEMFNTSADRRRILYEVIGRDADAHMLVKEDKNRGFPLRVNVRRPF
ncbi:hypothetical protein BKA66DRAFT_453928 [Pyrenochaeta sp. MPI-SDFR-AT-0127]|nr:hypothetical protein BKA66DRAFT_453928 [Pyrenochaeta sp. MPI-SDFR-AT-0127]